MIEAFDVRGNIEVNKSLKKIYAKKSRDESVVY